MSDFDYVSLDDAHFTPPFLKLGQTIAGLAALLLLSVGGNRLFMSDDNKALSSQQQLPSQVFVPKQGLSEVLVRPGTPGPLQLGVALSNTAPTCLFSYGSFREHDEDPSFLAGGVSQDGWVYGAKLRLDMFARPTGQPGDVVCGKVLCWSPHVMLHKIAIADKTRGLNASSKDDNRIRRAIVAVVLQDGSSLRAFWYYKEAPGLVRGKSKPGAFARKSLSGGNNQTGGVDFRGMTAEQLLQAVSNEALDLSSYVAAWYLLGQSMRRQIPSVLHGVRNDPRCVQLKDNIRDGLLSLSSVKLSNVWLGCRDLKLNDTSFLNELQGATLAKAANLEPQGLSNVFNSLASLAGDDWRPAGSFLNTLGEMSLKRIKSFKSQEIGNTLNALAKLQHKPGKELLAAMCEESLKKVATFKPQEISNFLNALVKLGYIPSTELVEVMLARADAQSGLFKPQEISNLMNALGKLNHFPGQAFSQKICEEAAKVVRDFKPQEIASLLNAVARLTFYPGKEILGMFSQECIKKAGSFTSQGISNTLNALAKLGFIPSHEFLVAMSAQALAKQNTFTNQNIANTLHALAVLEHFDYEVFAVFLTLIPKRSKDLEEEELSQLYFVDLFLRLEHPKTALALPVPIRKACTALQISRQESTTSSVLHKSVSQILTKEIKLKHDIEDHRTGLFLDIAVTANKIAIEVDGPLHFSIDAEGARRYLGTTMLKHRLLRCMGWYVVLVPFYEWDKLKQPEQKAVYLKMKIKTEAWLDLDVPLATGSIKR
eukprot:gb/GEZN01002448.1/.p1 GENE.gb/GEZN01002448.1/~~gb/GEZN01002448.1/.p1  ORF type:complete len:792 (-),score=114.56 gb/GEZN01002448.1/:104-2407(-)